MPSARSRVGFYFQRWQYFILQPSNHKPLWTLPSVLSAVSPQSGTRGSVQSPTSRGPIKAWPTLTKKKTGDGHTSSPKTPSSERLKAISSSSVGTVSTQQLHQCFFCKMTWWLPYFILICTFCRQNVKVNLQFRIHIYLRLYKTIFYIVHFDKV